MNNNYITEKIGAIKNEMSHIWGAIFVTGGGTATFIFTDLTPLKIAFIVLGIYLTVLFINAYIIRKNELMDYLEKLGEDF